MDVVSQNAHRALNYLARELQRKNGPRNGEIEAGPRAVEKSTGLHHRYYWAAIYELLALGLIEFHKGRFGVTWMRRYDGKEPSYAWMKFKTRRQATVTVELAVEEGKKGKARDTKRLAELVEKLPRPMTATERSRKRRARLAAERDNPETASDATRAPLGKLATKTVECNACSPMETGHRCNACSSMQSGHASKRDGPAVRNVGSVTDPAGAASEAGPAASPASGNGPLPPTAEPATRSAGLSGEASSSVEAPHPPASPAQADSRQAGEPIPIFEGCDKQIVTITPVEVTIDGVTLAQWQPSHRDRRH